MPVSMNDKKARRATTQNTKCVFCVASASIGALAAIL
jgi:hypothetical protein